MIGIFVNHWQIKLVALFLAVALWFYTSGQARVERTLTVKVPDYSSVQGLPQEYRITSISPREFTVEIDGPLTQLRNLDLQRTPDMVISARALAEGRQTFAISNDLLGLDADARIQRIRPEGVDAITVTFGKIESEQLLVDPPRLIDVPPGIEPAVALENNRVTVEGPKGLLEELKANRQRLRFEPVSLAPFPVDIDQPKSYRIKLTPDVPDSVHVREDVYATITTKPIDATRQNLNLPVHLLAPLDVLRKFRIELSQPSVVVTVRGPRNLINNLTPDNLTAYVNLRRALEPGKTEEVPVQVIGPTWMLHDPITIRVTATLAISEPAPAAPLPEAESGPPGEGRQ